MMRPKPSAKVGRTLGGILLLWNGAGRRKSKEIKTNYGAIHLANRFCFNFGSLLVEACLKV